MKLYVFFIIVLLSYNLFSQNTSSEPLIDIETKGANASNAPDDNKEYYAQYKTVLIGLSLSTKSKIQIGLSTHRIENDDILELPLLYKYQATESLSIYSGAQLQFTRGVHASNTSINHLQTSFNTGIDYQINSQWDVGIQFIAPINNGALPENDFNTPNPLRFRTGFKF